MAIPSLNAKQKAALREMGIPWIPVALLIAIAQLIESSPLQYHESWLVQYGMPAIVAVGYVATVINGLRYYSDMEGLKTGPGKLFILFYVLSTVGTPLAFLITFMRFDLVDFEVAAVIGFFLTILLHAYLAGVNRLMSSRAKEKELWEKKKWAQIDFVYGPTLLPLCLTPFILAAPFLDEQISYSWLYFTITFLSTVAVYFLKQTKAQQP